MSEPLTIGQNLDAGLINNKKFQKEIVQTGTSISEPLKFEKIKVIDDFKIQNLPINSEMHNPEADLNKNLDSLFLPKNIQVGNVNGEDFNGFLNQLCMKNIETVIPRKTKINGVFY